MSDGVVCHASNKNPDGLDVEVLLLTTATTPTSALIPKASALDGVSTLHASPTSAESGQQVACNISVGHHVPLVYEHGRQRHRPPHETVDAAEHRWFYWRCHVKHARGGIDADDNACAHTAQRQ